MTCTSDDVLLLIECCQNRSIHHSHSRLEMDTRHRYEYRACESISYRLLSWSTQWSNGKIRGRNTTTFKASSQVSSLRLLSICLLFRANSTFFVLSVLKRWASEVVTWLMAFWLPLLSAWTRRLDAMPLPEVFIARMKRSNSLVSTAIITADRLNSTTQSKVSRMDTLSISNEVLSVVAGIRTKKLDWVEKAIIVRCAWFCVHPKNIATVSLETMASFQNAKLTEQRVIFDWIIIDPVWTRDTKERTGRSIRRTNQTCAILGWLIDQEIQCTRTGSCEKRIHHLKTPVENLWIGKKKFLGDGEIAGVGA